MTTSSHADIILFPLAGVPIRTIRCVQKAWCRLAKAGDTSGWMLIEADGGSAEEQMTRMKAVAGRNADAIILIAGDDTKGRITAATAMRTGLIPVIIGRPEDYRKVVEHLYNGMITTATTRGISVSLRMLLTEPRRRAAMLRNAII